ncbi:MAG: condensation domain-containing protein [Pyrinomonadaceae bacterium]|nr:condensation domain-containing protein [Pyrinomonadaceae bacterium]
MSDLQKEISGLTPERRNLLALIIKRDAEAAASAQKIERREKAEPEVSFAQQRLWFLQKLDPENPVYNTPAAIKIDGDLNVEILEKVFNHIVLRHEILRTVFKEENGKVVQRLHPGASVEILKTDLEDFEKRENCADELINKDIRIPFATDKFPLFRIHLYRLNRDQHILLLNMHHIISDGWSLGVIIDEFVRLYADHNSGRGSSLPPLEIQYADFAFWERKMIESKIWQTQLEFWKNALSEPVGSVKFPPSKKSNEHKTDRVGTVSLILRAELTSEIRRVCAAEHYTLYMYLLSAFQTLLYRYSGQRKFLIGSPVANRNRTETENLIGCFINPLAVRATPEGNQTFGELLKQTRKTVLDSFANQEIPFELVLDSIRRQRNEPQTRLFNVWFVLQNAPLSEVELPHLTISNYQLPRLAAQFDIALNINEIGEEIHCSIDFAADRFDDGEIVEMLEHFRNILAETVENRDLKLNGINLEKKTQKESAKSVVPIDEDTFDF